MKNKFMQPICGAALAILILTIFAPLWMSAQDGVDKEQIKEQTEGILLSQNTAARTLEGSWSVQVTIRNCQTGAALASFPSMNTFMRGGTMQEFSAGAAPLPRGPGHGVWSYQSGQNYSYAFQFFRFNADGTYAGVTRARRQVQLGSSQFNSFGNSYEAVAAIEIFNAAGSLIATACATETAVRFE